MEENEKSYTLEEASKNGLGLLKISRQRIHQLARNGEINIFLSSMGFRITESEIRRFNSIPRKTGRPKGTKKVLSTNDGE